MKKILVTGGTGFVGSNLVSRLVHQGYETHVVVRKNSSIDELKSLDRNLFIHVYTHSLQSMTEIFKNASPDIVVHLASLFISEHNADDIDELFQSNLLFGTHLLEAMKQMDVNYLINTGTNWQNYCGSDYNPVNLYAATKEAFEDIAKFYTQSTSMRMLTLRLYDTYGPNDKRPKILSLFKKIARTEENLDMSPGDQLLGFVYIDDVVDAFLGAIELIKLKEEHYQEVFFLNPDKYYSLKEVVGIYEEVKAIRLNINWGLRQYRSREVMKPFEGNRLPGWNPRINLREGLNLV
ncbi:MAG: NAD(P)-dependent oxidoreductase [Acetobacterium woodii]|nr:NAD(P)-dependent oxidoreductase [Acetobacterium woodii]